MALDSAFLFGGGLPSSSPPLLFFFLFSLPLFSLLTISSSSHRIFYATVTLSIFALCRIDTAIPFFLPIPHLIPDSANLMSAPSDLHPRRQSGIC